MIYRILKIHSMIVFLSASFMCNGVIAHELDESQPSDNLGSVAVNAQILPTAIVAKFYRLARDQSWTTDSTTELYAFINSLSKGDQATLAGVLLTDQDPIISSLGIIIALRTDRFDLAVPKLKLMVRKGEDLSEFYSYLNSADYIDKKELLLKDIQSFQ